MTNRKLNEAQMEDNAQLTSYMIESLNNIQTVKAYNKVKKLHLLEKVVQVRQP